MRESFATWCKCERGSALYFGGCTPGYVSDDRGRTAISQQLIDLVLKIDCTLVMIVVIISLSYILKMKRTTSN